MRESISDELDRIHSLYGIDQGFYVLAIHSFIESFTDRYHQEIQLRDTFAEKLDLLSLLLGYDIRVRKPQVIWRLCREHRCTNEVRHGFIRLSSDEAIGATKNFLDFCRLTGIDDRSLEQFQQDLNSWRDAAFSLEQHRELITLRHSVRSLSRENSELRERSSSYDEQQTEDAQRRLNELVSANRALKERLDTARSKDDRHRQQLYEAREKERKLQKRMLVLQGQKQYLSYLQRYTSYSRTRADHQRSLMTLSAQQRRICSRIREPGDHLIRGGAGTGKTLVLLHACIEQLEGMRAEVSKPEDTAKQPVLLTYTHSLVKFDQYLSTLFHQELKPGIRNIDAFLMDRLKTIDPECSMDYAIVSELLKDSDLQFITAKELEAEISMAIFGRALSEESYLQDPKSRRGMKNRLSPGQKQQIWELSVQLREQMISRRAFSKEFGRLFLYELLIEDTKLRERLQVERIFIDELQDLSPVDLMLLASLSGSGLVMAGDERQSIYYSGMSFRRRGLNISGRSHTLTGNHRNTRQIHMLSELYRSKTSTEGISPEENTSFREGPAVELWQQQDPKRLLSLLEGRIRLFIETLGYAPENIGVLTPDRKTLRSLAKSLEASNREYCDIHAPEFHFDQTPGIRISTCHSAKGIEFPVVMLVLPSLPVSSRLSEDCALQAARNLLYMSLTRALDDLQIFTLEATESTPIAELLEVFREYERLSEDEDLQTCLCTDAEN